MGCLTYSAITVVRWFQENESPLSPKTVRLTGRMPDVAPNEAAYVRATENHFDTTAAESESEGVRRMDAAAQRACGVVRLRARSTAQIIVPNNGESMQRAIHTAGRPANGDRTSVIATNEIVHRSHCK